MSSRTWEQRSLVSPLDSLTGADVRKDFLPRVNITKNIFAPTFDNRWINDVIGSIDIFHRDAGSEEAISFRGRGRKGCRRRMLGGKITAGDRRDRGERGVKVYGEVVGRGKKLAVRVFHATTVHPPSIFGKPINLPRPLQSGRGFRCRRRLANA